MNDVMLRLAPLNPCHVAVADYRAIPYLPFLLTLTISGDLTCRSAPENVAMSDEGVRESALSQQGHRRRRSNPPRKLSGPGPHAEDNLERGAIGHPPKGTATI